MISEIDLLNDICKNAEMGRDNLSHVLKQSTDSQLQQALSKQMQGYQETYDSACKLLRESGQEPEHASNMAKTMAHVSSSMKTMRDDSPSQIAEMVIQGSTMGITKMTQRIHEYQGNNREVISLAEQEIRKEQANIEEMKKYL